MPNQAINNEIIRTTILELAEANGGLIKIAKKAGMNYSTLHNQMNRNAGVLAYSISLITGGLKTPRLLETICDPCGYIPVHKEAFLRTRHKSIRKREVDISIQIGNALKIIEEAHSDGKITKPEYKEIHSALNELMRKEAELDLQIKGEVRR